MSTTLLDLMQRLNAAIQRFTKSTNASKMVINYSC